MVERYSADHAKEIADQYATLLREVMSFFLVSVQEDEGGYGRSDREV